MRQKLFKKAESIAPSTMDCLSLAQSDIINTEDSASQVMIRNPHPQAPTRGHSDLSKTLRKPLLPQKLLELGSQVSFYKN